MTKMIQDILDSCHSSEGVCPSCLRTGPNTECCPHCIDFWFSRDPDEFESYEELSQEMPKG